MATISRKAVIAMAGVVAVMSSSKNVAQGNFDCMQVIGFSQTNQWYKSFEKTIHDRDKWECLWNGGAAINGWSRPNFKPWNNKPVSPCRKKSKNPDKVLLTVSGAFGSDIKQWKTHISGAIKVIRSKYSSVHEIFLQPVVGDHNKCPNVRASRQHGSIQQACEEVAAGDPDVRMSFDPHLRSCADYSDGKGHLRSGGAAYIGAEIAKFYNTLFGSTHVRAENGTLHHTRYHSADTRAATHETMRVELYDFTGRRVYSKNGTPGNGPGHEGIRSSGRIVLRRSRRSGKKVSPAHSAFFEGN